MLTHILAGSRGPVVTAVVEHYRLPQYGVLKPLGHSQVKQLTREVCGATPHFEVAQGRVRLKRPTDKP